MIKELRKKLNDGTREFGNSLTPRLKSILDFGLGDLLTVEVTIPRVGATLGALAPVAGVGALEYYNSCLLGSLILTPIVYLGMFPITVPSSIVLGCGGYSLGRELQATKQSIGTKIAGYLRR